MNYSHRTRLAAILAAGTGAAAILASCTSIAPPPLFQGAAGSGRCEDMATLLAEGAPADDLVITAASWRPVGTPIETRLGEKTDLPGHCLVEGYYGEREGRVGGTYRIAFRMRLPIDWNGRFFFEGGGGSNGVVRDASGYNGVGNALALARGYAVIAQDSGHDNERNNVPEYQGDLVFGFDPQARRNYGHASLKTTYDIGRHVLRVFYGRDSDTEFFWGCSKGGQEGMAFAQRYPEAFDGIFSMAPGMSLPRAALAEAWDTQQFASIIAAQGKTPTVFDLSRSFSEGQLALVSEAVIESCDADDGAMDGIVGTVGSCTTQRVLPALRARQCDADEQTCLSKHQIDALVRVMEGVRDSSGRLLYAPWTWDTGMGGDDWRRWKIGSPDGPPAFNVLLGAGSLAAVFTSPPTALARDPQALFAWQMAFDFDRDATRIYAVEAPYETSPWQDIGMRSPDLAAFASHGGRLIVPHGGSDPVFSLLDTIGWWEEVDAAAGGKAADFARVFPVPGMNHCNGGPATDRFDGLGALEDWVLKGEAPDTIAASADPAGPLKGASRPLCPWPSQLHAEGDGTFSCR